MDQEGVVQEILAEAIQKEKINRLWVSSINRGNKPQDLITIFYIK